MAFSFLENGFSLGEPPAADSVPAARGLAHISARSLDLGAVPGSELFLFQIAISGKNAAISLRILAVSGFRHQNEGLRPRFF